jgi:hypothetical protein
LIQVSIYIDRADQIQEIWSRTDDDKFRFILTLDVAPHCVAIRIRGVYRQRPRMGLIASMRKEYGYERTWHVGANVLFVSLGWRPIFEGCEIEIQRRILVIHVMRCKDSHIFRMPILGSLLSVV